MATPVPDLLNMPVGRGWVCCRDEQILLRKVNVDEEKGYFFNYIQKGLVENETGLGLLDLYCGI